MAKLQITPTEKVFDKIIRHIRERDALEGNDLLKRFTDGFQDIYDQVFVKIEGLRDLIDVDNAPVLVLPFLQENIGILPSWTELLSDADRRKLISLVVAHWKLKSTRGSFVNILRSILKQVPQYRDYFFYEWSLDEIALGEENYIQSLEGLIDVFFNDETDNAASFLINFTKTGAAASPANYNDDVGLVYTTTRGYGWDVDVSANTVERSLQRDVRLDTLIFNSNPVREWKIDVTNGWYEVTVVVGDAGFTEHQRIAINNEIVLTGPSPGALSRTNEFITIRKIVKVTDKLIRIRIGNDEGSSVNTTICYAHFLKRLDRGFVDGVIKEHEPITNDIVPTFCELLDEFDSQPFTDTHWEEIPPGEPVIAGGKMVISNNQEFETTVFGDDSWVNYVLSLRPVRFTAFDGSAGEAFIIDFYSDLNRDDWFRIQVQTANDVIVLRRFLDNIGSDIVTVPFKVFQDVDYVMNVIVQTSLNKGRTHDIVFTIDETEIIRVTRHEEKEIHGGGVRLRCTLEGTVAVTIDEVKVVPFRYTHTDQVINFIIGGQQCFLHGLDTRDAGQQCFIQGA